MSASVSPLTRTPMLSDQGPTLRTPCNLSFCCKGLSPTNSRTGASTQEFREIQTSSP